MNAKGKNVKKFIALLLSSILCLGMLSGCGAKPKIIIYSSAEDYRNDYARQQLKEHFPGYEIDLVDMDTGTLAAKLAVEETNIEADIIMELESTYMAKYSDSLAVLDSIDFDIYVDNLVPQNHRYVPWTRLSGAIVIDPTALEEKGVPLPTCYEDLIKPEYKGLISMPNPKSSGTGYIFLLNLVNEMGEDEAFAYFDKLAENLNGQGFTTSGSGPVKALVTREAAIALGMTFQAATSITDGNDFQILFFAEGAPYTSYSSAIIEGRQKKEEVMEVFDYICKEISPKDKELYVPETIFKDRQFTMENFPEDIPYGDMTGIDDIELKERLLDKWNH